MRICAFAMFVVAAGATMWGAPVHLRTNSLDSPIGIDTPHPLFSWQTLSAARDWKQTGYEVLVATDAKLLVPGKADGWDSGRVASADSVNIRYAGGLLRPQTHYVWAVRVWDAQGKPGGWARSSFEMGLLLPSDWKAQWIMRTDAAAEAEIAAVRWIWLPGRDSEHVPGGTPAHFLYRLRVQGKPRAVSLHVLAAGRFVSHVNGVETGHHDDWGAFDQEEVTNLIHPGDNEIELDVVSRGNSGSKETYPNALAAAIHVTDASGRERRIVTDAAWLCRSGEDGAWVPARVAGPISAKYMVGVDRHTPEGGPDRVATDASLFRKSFAAAGQVVSARLSVTALGAYVVYLNGRQVAPKTLLSPGWTDFKKRVDYQTYDVTSLVANGDNTLGAMLGGGWYSSPMTWAGYRAYPGGNLLRAQLDLTMADGTHQSVFTDGSWQTAGSPITFAEIYGGEAYDARLKRRDWDAAGASAGEGWDNAVVGAPPHPNMEVTAQPDLPITNQIVLKPVSLTPANADHPAVFDMGQNMVGNIRLHVRGARGTVVKMRFAERLNADGSIYTENLRNADATDTYILSGEGDETYTPSFTFHGFRYVELSGFATPTLATVEGFVFNSLPAIPTIRLSSSSEILNKMNELGTWGQRGNFVSIPTDCPQRDERLGWMGDAGAFWRTGTFNFDIDSFSHKFMLDVDDAQTAAGEFTDVSPNILGPTTGAPGWGDAGIFIPYATWLQYGDLAIVQSSWPAMERWMDNILSHNPNYLRQQHLGNNYADWLAPDQNTPKDLIATAYWALIAREMTEMAKALGSAEDAARYEALYDHIATAYRAAYVAADGSVKGNTQTAYLATLFTGIAPEAQRAEMTRRVVSNIEAHGNHLTTGFLGTPFLLAVLDQNDRSDVAFRLLLSDTYPSWGYMVKKGATTWWERWNGDTGDPSMNSYNHYAFGSVMAWVYRRAAGIDTDASGPGFRHLRIEPHFDTSLPRLHVEYDSAYGTVVSDWQQSLHRFTVTIPANTTADVRLPDGRHEAIGSGTYAYRIR